MGPADLAAIAERTQHSEAPRRVKQKPPAIAQSSLENRCTKSLAGNYKKKAVPDFWLDAKGSMPVGLFLVARAAVLANRERVTALKGMLGMLGPGDCDISGHHRDAYCVDWHVPGVRFASVGMTAGCNCIPTKASVVQGLFELHLL